MTMSNYIKALDDWQLDVLGVPFGGPVNGKDAHGEYFDERSDLELDTVTPILHYYHGYAEDGKPQGKPQKIGRVVSTQKRGDGVWYRVILDKASKLAARVYDAAKRGLAVASSGTAEHLRRVASDGHIDYWPVFELSIFDADENKRPANSYAIAMPALKAVYEQAGQELPDILREPNTTEAEAEGVAVTAAYRAEAVGDGAAEINTHEGEIKMDEKEQIKEAVEAAIKADREAREAEEAARKAEAAKIETAVKDAREKWEAENAKDKRLPDSVILTNLGEIGKYDNLSLAEMDAVLAVMRQTGVKTSDSFLKAYGMKAEAEENKAVSRGVLSAIKGLGIKADELNYSTLSGYGSQFVGTAYSNQIWEAVRQLGGIVNRIPQEVVPDGYSSKYWPVESADPTWYLVAEGTADEDYSYEPARTVTTSKLATANKQLALKKIGAAVMYTGEMVEDSLVAWAPNLQQQLTKSGNEILEHVVIDGDDATGGTTNINDIAGTPAGTEPFLAWDGMRLVALANNARSASGGLTADDYVNTLKLLGTAGIKALDPAACAFIVDPNTYWASLKLDEVKTRDVFGPATIESGQLTRMFGRDLIVSAQMHFMSAARKANSAGKVDQDTTPNNLYGAILAVHFDSWKFAYKRRMTMEITRYAKADAYEITALIRCGLAYRDTSAASISYYVGV